MTNLHSRRTEARAKLAELREQRGAAALEGRKFSVKAIQDAEAELENIDAALAEQVRRNRRDAADEFLKTKQKNMDRLRRLEDERQAKFDVAEDAVRTLASAITEILHISKEMSGVFHSLTKKVPAQLSRQDICQRIVWLLSAVMSIVPGCRGGLGGLKWQSSMRTANDSWSECERKQLASAMARAIGETKESDDVKK